MTSLLSLFAPYACELLVTGVGTPHHDQRIAITVPLRGGADDYEKPPLQASPAVLGGVDSSAAAGEIETGEVNPVLLTVALRCGGCGIRRASSLRVVRSEGRETKMRTQLLKVIYWFHRLRETVLSRTRAVAMEKQARDETPVFVRLCVVLISSERGTQKATSWAQLDWKGWTMDVKREQRGR